MMSREKQRRHSLPNISPPVSRTTASVPLGPHTPRITTPSSSSSIPNNAPPKGRRHSIAQPYTSGTTPYRRPALSPLPESDHSQGVEYPVAALTEVTVNSLVDAYLKDADVHLKLGKLPDGSNLMEAVLSEMRLENKYSSCSDNDDMSGDDVIEKRGGNQSGDDVFSETKVTQNSQSLIKMNTSPKRK